MSVDGVGRAVHDPRTLADTVFVGATLIDGTGAPPSARAAVLVTDGRFEWIGPADDLDATRDVEVVDVDGKHLIPGLLDANVHLVLHYAPDVLLRYEPGRYDELVVEAAQIALRAGITTVFDTWGPLEALRRVRDRIDRGEVTGSRIYFAGNIIGNAGPWSSAFWEGFGQHLSSATVDAVNGHWEQGVGGELPWLAADDVRTTVREYIATSGIDFVKYASSAHHELRFIALSPDSQRAIVEEAHAAGLTAQACSMTPEALKLAVEAGVDLLQHANVTGRKPMPEPLLELIVERGLPCILLLMTDRNLAALDDLRHPWGQLFRELTLTKDVSARRLIEAGATPLLATDGGVFGELAETSPLFRAASMPDSPLHLGRSHVFWLQAAIERGVKPMDALLAATRNIADAYGKGGELGTIAPGTRADFVVLDGDPLVDVENYTRITHVVKDGRLVDRDRLPEHPVLTRRDTA